MLSDEVDYQDLGGDYFAKGDTERTRKRAISQLQGVSATASFSRLRLEARSFGSGVIHLSRNGASIELRALQASSIRDAGAVLRFTAWARATCEVCFGAYAVLTSAVHSPGVDSRRLVSVEQRGNRLTHAWQS